jgi:hypothetical protein
MPHRITLLAAATLIVACADSEHPTTPGSRQPSRLRTVDAPSLIQSPSTEAKPLDQVGFTKVTSVPGPEFIHVAPGDDIDVAATCPAGTIAIGGGYRLTLFTAGATPPLVMAEGVNTKNGWELRLNNQVSGAGSFTFFIAATCIS